MMAAGHDRVDASGVGRQPRGGVLLLKKQVHGVQRLERGQQAGPHGCEEQNFGHSRYPLWH